MPKKKTWAESWGASPVDYARGTEELAKELKKIRNMTTRRIASLKRGKYYSYATAAFEQKIKQTYMTGKYPSVDEMNYKQIERELRYHHEFWASDTSTKKGVKETIIEQSVNFFGANKRGKPRHIMTTSEGAAVWSLYNEFYNMYKESTAKYDSFRLQTMIGAAVEAQNFNPKDFVKTLGMIRLAMEADFEAGSPEIDQDDITNFMREVFSGYGNDF